MQKLGGSLMTPEYAQNSGLLGSLAMVAQAYAGKKLSGKASEDEALARERYYKGEAAMKDAEAQREAARKRAADAAERAQREADAKKYRLDGRDATRYVLEGKIGELPSITPLATDQGYIGVRRDGTYQPLTPAGAQNVQIAGDVPEQVRQAIMADPQAWENGDSIDIRQPQRPLMPYKDPAIAQRHAAQDARADASLDLARRSAERADRALELQQQSARNRPTTEDQNKSAGYALRMERALESIAGSAEKNPGANQPGFGTALIDMLPEAAGNYLKSDERQNIEAAQLDALDAALTLNTGAAYTREQLYGLRKSYFPQPGDSESTIKAKEDRLKGLIDTARLRARGAYPQEQQKPDAQEPQQSNRIRIKL